MIFPLGVWDLSLWLAFTATILFITTELLSPFYGKNNLYIDHKRLKKTALTVTILLLITVALRIIQEIVAL